MLAKTILSLADVLEDLHMQIILHVKEIQKPISQSWNAHISRNETLLQRLKTDMQCTAYLFQIPVFNYYMLTENSGHTGTSSFIFAHIFQIIPDIPKRKFFFLTGKKIIQRVDRNNRTS